MKITQRGLRVLFSEQCLLVIMSKYAYCINRIDSIPNMLYLESK